MTTTQETTRSLASYSNQEAFDVMLTCLRQQGQPAIRTNEDTGNQYCAYRGNDGLKCAVGALIRDEDYDPHFELSAISEFGYSSFGLTDDQVKFLSDAQRLLHDTPCFEDHLNSPSMPDSPTFLDLMERGAQSLAEKYSLTYTPPTQSCKASVENL